jgi:hypothetical protein
MILNILGHDYTLELKECDEKDNLLGNVDYACLIITLFKRSWSRVVAKDQMLNVLLHETGHAYDRLLNKPMKLSDTEGDNDSLYYIATCLIDFLKNNCPEALEAIYKKLIEPLYNE